MTGQTVQVNHNNNTIAALPRSLRSIVGQLEESRPLTPKDVASILREAHVDPTELQPWSAFDHPVEDSYGRKLVYQGSHFEIMVMSWCPGDFSAMHDHGHAQWGAVQIFGPAEHAVFEIQDNVLTTVDRWDVIPGDILHVDHDLIHQMGNPTRNQFFLSLHIYGDVQESESITGDARIFDPVKGIVRYVNGGVFFAPPDHTVVRTTDGPFGDFPTRLRYQVELSNRLLSVCGDKPDHATLLEDVVSETFSSGHRSYLLEYLRHVSDQENMYTEKTAWRVLNRELRHAARLQRRLKGDVQTQDQFHRYAEVYDGLVGTSGT